MSSIFDQALDESQIRFADLGAGDGATFAQLQASIRNAPRGPEEYADVPEIPDAGKFGRLTEAAYRQTLTGDLTTSRQLAQESAYDGIIATVRNASGVSLENPMRGGYLDQVPAYREERGLSPEPIENRPDIVAAQAALFDQKLDEIAKGSPELARVIDASRELFTPSAVAKRAEEDFRTASAEMTPGGVLAASVIGGLPASLRDPVNVAGLAATGGESAAATVAGRLVSGMIREAAVNAGMTAVAQPLVQLQRADLGLEAGLMQGVSNVLMAGLIGGGFGLTFGGARELIKTGPLKGLRPGDLPERERGLLDFAAGAEISDAAARADAPPRTVDGFGGQRSYEQAVDFVQGGEAPPPELVFDFGEPDAARQLVTREELPARPGETSQVDGKPVRFERFEPADLNTDAAAFQYKGGGDVAGVTERLRSVTQWDPVASGKVLVFEAENGVRFVADGHQRLGLAKRLAPGDDSIRLDGFLFRQRDGWTPADVRALAAKKNMQEGSGDALDAARVIRDRPDLVDGSLPTTAPMMRQALALARLSDEAWGMTLNGLVPPNYAAAVGATVADPLQHAAVLALLREAQPETERAARLLIGEAMEAGFTIDRQIDLFGASDATRSLMGERVAVLDAAMTALRKDARLFNVLARSADAIEGAGNVLARDSNESRAMNAAGLEEILAKLARRSGPISDALNVQAARVADGTARTTASKAFLEQLQAVVEKRGLIGLLKDAPELKPAVTVEPGTPEAARLAGEAAETPPKPGEPAPAPDTAKETPIVPMASVMELRAGQAGRSVEDVHARATAFQPELAAAGAEIAEATGAKFLNPGVKKLETAAEKITRKGYKDASSLTDLARGGFSVATPDQADAVVAALGQRFSILDEGWATSPGGYTDRKVLVRAPDGTVAEIQIAAEAMWAAKKNGGQDLYTVFRQITDPAERRAAEASSIQFYADALAGADPAWNSVGGITSEPKNGSNVARQTGSDITAPVDQTSLKSTLDQPPSGSRTANAAPADVSSTAGRQSQLMNDGITASEPSVRAADQNGKAASSPSGEHGEPGLWDAVPMGERDDGGDARMLTREAALAEADRSEMYADLVAACRG